jgi:glucose-6-phosphate 1-dehydrogenase
MNTTTTNPNLEPALIVIFGVTGDLSKRYLLPALYHLIKDGLLDDKTEIIGVSRREISPDDLLKDVELCVQEKDNVCDPAALEAMRNKFRMLQLDPVNGGDYDNLLKTLNAIEDEKGVCMNRLYYLSIPPGVYGPIVRNLGGHGLNESCQHGKAATRLLVEKPFGYDLASAEQLIEETSQWFSEKQVFRIDHYLAKETVQNILAFRKENYVFSSLWNHQHIQKITIEAYEKIGIESRADFYENTGALRDFTQSHLLQLLALVTMELPKNEGDTSLHAAKQRLLEAVQPVSPDKVARDVYRGQYEGYRDEVNNPHSTTETFVSMKLSVDNERWQNVPIYLATGKAMSRKYTAITVIFKADGSNPPNQLRFRLQPNEGIGLKLCVKKPDFAHEVQTALMDFSYQATFDQHGHPDAYERVIVDAVRGDQSLFATSEEVLASWRILQPAIDEWSKGADDLFFYPKGTDPKI